MVVPTSMEGLCGAMTRDTSVSEFTVRTVDPVMFPDVAVIVVVPGVNAVASPLEPAVLLMDATAVCDELQVTAAVRSPKELFEYFPMAVNCRIVDKELAGLDGATVMETIDAGGTDGPLLVFPLVLLQPAAAAQMRRSIMTLFDFIDADSLRDEVRRIGAALQIAHVAPTLHNNPARLHLNMSSAPLPRGLALGLPVLFGIRTQKHRKIGRDRTVPGDAENDAGRRYIFSNRNQVGAELVDRIVG